MALLLLHLRPGRLPPRFLLPSLPCHRRNIHTFSPAPLPAGYSSIVPGPSDHVFLGLSSGVDSTISAHLLLSHLHLHPSQIHPFYLINWSPTQHPPSTPTSPLPGEYGRPDLTPKTPPQQKCIDRELSRVRELCSFLGLNEPIVLNLEKDYWSEVFEPMLDAYRTGTTPNPDILCNREIKFGAPMLKLLEAQAAKLPITPASRWWLSTGHYALTARSSAGCTHLLRAPNSAFKDQTYFLSALPRSTLPHTFFPLGYFGLSKLTVKSLATSLSIPGWRSCDPNPTKESMGLCFVEPQHLGRNAGFRRFLGEYLEEDRGTVRVDEFRGYYYSGKDGVGMVRPARWPEKGMEVGEHEGLWTATVGEKVPGLELPQGSREFMGRWYVSRKDPQKNEMWIVRSAEAAQLWARRVRVGRWRWLVGEEERSKVLGGEVEVKGQYRHGMEEVGVKVQRIEGDGDGEVLKVEFEVPQRAVAEGQVVALWAGEVCLGGGVVDGVEMVGKEDIVMYGDSSEQIQ